LGKKKDSTTEKAYLSWGEAANDCIFEARTSPQAIKNNLLKTVRGSVYSSNEVGRNNLGRTRGGLRAVEKKRNEVRPSGEKCLALKISLRRLGYATKTFLTTRNVEVGGTGWGGCSLSQLNLKSSKERVKGGTNKNIES